MYNYKSFFVQYTSILKTSLINNSHSKTLTRYSAKENLFYYLPTQDQPEYFPRCEYHSRFPGVLAMDKAEVYNTYPRSDRKRLVDIKRSSFHFKGNQAHVMNGMYPKTGNFFNPFHFPAYQNALSPVIREAKPADATLYNRLLERQKRQSAQVVEALKIQCPDLAINADNRYTCVLVALPKPPAEKNIKTWTNVVGVIYLAIVNKLAYEKGINIEAHLRASFGTFKPSVAECGDSLRLSLGLVPDAYVDCVKQALVYTQQLFSSNDAALMDSKRTAIFGLPFVSKRLANDLVRYNQVKKSRIGLKPTLWQTLWAAGDSKGCSFATQIFRKPHTTEYLIDLIFDALLKAPLATIFGEHSRLKNAFALPFSKLLKCYRLQDNHLTFDLSKAPLKSYQWQREMSINDNEFWEDVRSVCVAWRIKPGDLQRIMTAKKTTYLHTLFDHLASHFTFAPNAYDDVKDGGGSDSEEEEELALTPHRKKTMHAKKFITATGMRAIQLSFAVAQKCLENKRVDLLKIVFSATKMYYETHEALNRHPIPVTPSTNLISRRKGHIGFFDLNHCNASQEKDQSLLASVKKNDVIAIVDTTSATTVEMNDILKKLYHQKPKLLAVLFVSSGLKNEQSMSDYNPYGTIRIFGDSKEICQSLYEQLVALEQQAGYTHPKQSHWIRKTAKENGMTPTNSNILSP